MIRVRHQGSINLKIYHKYINKYNTSLTQNTKSQQYHKSTNILTIDTRWTLTPSNEADFYEGRVQKMDYKKFTCIRKLTLKLFAEKYISLQKMGWRKLQLRINEKVLKTIYRYIICNTLFVNHKCE